MSGSGGSFADILRGEAQKAGSQGSDVKGKDAPMNIMEFIESPVGLRFTDELQGASLFPVQRVILKAYYNLPLDDQVRNIRIPRHWRYAQSPKPEHHYEFTEAEYLEYLYNEGRSNIKTVTSEVRNTMVLTIGRRSGKSTISAMIAAYETYKLIRLRNPQKYYGLTPGNRIQIVAVAPTTDAASLLYNDVRKHFLGCQYFAPYMTHTTQKYVAFQTPHDVEQTGSHSSGGISSVRSTFFSSNSKGIRGSANIVAILDELAFFARNGNSSDSAVLQAVEPSLATFSPKNPDNPREPIGDVESRLIMISSPGDRAGSFYERYSMALSGTKGILMIQAPTWEVNPTVPVSFFEEQYAKDPSKFMCEFGAQFTDTLSAWIEDDEVLRPCLDLQLRPEVRGKSRVPHFLGLDVAVVGDRTAVVLTRPEGGRVRLVYHEQWQAGVPWQDINPHLPEGPWFDYAKTLQGVHKLDFEQIAEWLSELSKRFLIEKGLFDQWSGISLEQSLQRRNLTDIESKQFTRNESGLMFQGFKQLLYHEKLLLYDFPSRDTTNGAIPNKHSMHIQELLELEASFEGKGVLHVEKPKIRGKHDDFSDALVRSVWLSYQSLGKGAALGGGSNGASGPARRGVGWDPTNPANWDPTQAAVHGTPLMRPGGLIPPANSPYVTQRPHGSLARRMRGRAPGRY